MSGDELEIVAWLRTQQTFEPRVALGIGDDMAVLAPQEGFLLVASDMLLDGVHFDSTRDNLAAIGRKALACNLSDCAAMAVCPLAATVSLALPRTTTLDQIKELYRCMFALAREFDVAIVGGDTTRWDHPLVIDVAITATAHQGVDPVTRCRARTDDRLYVTGKLGGSLISGRHLSFTPRVKEAQRIAKQLGVGLHALMDISDGLSLDLWRMCQASKVGAVLHEQELQQVIHGDVAARSNADFCGTGFQPMDSIKCGTGFQPVISALEHALSDGEDFELLLAVHPQADVSMLNLLPVGEITTGGYHLRRVDGSQVELQPRGYIH